jgi:hypothetical protein
VFIITVIEVTHRDDPSQNYKYSVPILQKTQWVFITKTDRLMMSWKTITNCWANRTKHINRLWENCICLMLQQMVRLITTVLQWLNAMLYNTGLQNCHISATSIHTVSTCNGACFKQNGYKMLHRAQTEQNSAPRKFTTQQTNKNQQCLSTSSLVITRLLYLLHKNV